jgi:hypothetical protein
LTFEAKDDAVLIVDTNRVVPRQIGHELAVDYVLEGSVRRAARRPPRAHHGSGSNSETASQGRMLPTARPT